MIRYAVVTMISREHGLQTAKMPIGRDETTHSVDVWIKRKVEELELSAGWRVAEIITR